MNLRFCLVLALLACSKKLQTEDAPVCRVEGYYLPQDASGRALDIADARKAPRVTGFPVRRPKTLTFWRGLEVEWEAYDVLWTKELEWAPESAQAKVIDPLDGGATAYPIRVEGSPPKSVTLAFPSRICSPASEPQTCADETEEKIVFATYRCAQEQLYIRADQ